MNISKRLKDKKIIIGIGLSLVFVVGIIFVFFNSFELKLKSSKFIFEYGNPILLELEDCLDLEGIDEIKKQDIFNNTQLRWNIVNENQKDYPAIGEYDASLIYKEKELHFKIVVQDTIAPLFEELKDTVETYENVPLDYSKLYKAKDLSLVTVTCDDHSVNYHQVGQYQATIIASDTSHNQTIQEITVSVKKPRDVDYVKIKDYIPHIYVDLKYATKDNFTKQKIYDFQDAYLRYGTVKKLIKVQDELEQQGYCLKIWDAYRPVLAQKKLWQVVNDSRYVANPAKGPRSHNLGGTVDITIVKKDGTDLPMPTQFDEFSKQADRDYRDITDQQAIYNVKLLEKTMYKYGFTGYRNEWWDYTDQSSYSYIDFIPQS